MKEQEYRDYGAVDFTEREIELVEEQTEKDMKDLDPLFEGD